MKDFLKRIIGPINFKRILVTILLLLFFAGAVGFGLRSFGDYINSLRNFKSGNGFQINPMYLFDSRTWVIGILADVIGGVVYLLTGNNMNHLFKNNKDLLGKDGQAEVVRGSLENSRFLTDKERDSYFPGAEYSALKDVKKDGIPVRAVLDKKNHLQVNFLSGAHSLIIGATGSGKTTTFINPMIQLLAATNCGSSMIMTDPKGELFSLHSKYLQERGYEVLLLDLRDTYSSSRWNPLGDIYDMYQEYVHAGEGIVAHKDDMADYPDLKQLDGPAEPGELWCEWNGNAYADPSHALDDVMVKRQQIYDEMYEDLNDLISVIVPIENAKDPLWEKGARSIIMATCLAMLEDSEDERLGMTKDKFNFFNINKALTNSENNFATLKEYFEGRNTLSQAYTLSRQVLSAAEQTMSSYMSITFDKLNMFNDRGLCGLTSATDVDAASFADKPTALFMKIPDEKDTRHGLAAVFILCMYKALIKVASAREDLSLPRNVYFILDEFGNMPKIEKFDKMITVGRSRKIWFNMVVQSYSQLSNVYGNEVADIVKSNCGMKMFIGSNDIGTCEEFSKLCGNMTVKTTSTSASIGAKEGDLSLSAQTQVRPLIYPSELQMLNNKESTGNAIIVTFGNYPLKTKYTPSYKCPYYQIGQMDLGEIRSHMFRADDVYYDLDARNEIVLGS
ncbi:Type IV secretory system Conjugative DNA transfer [Pseudobutyrivibrio sp. YE44]|uniref:type IV secretory system conjugative DNA transfer family protein n=1 Tax=Pseudobutyrivibrio sp. YE44 TaxID=1520802 RepID=UPI00087FAB40|nr:type IV secretory system conjugative DNA transfer family protein [Pseudobutyrivibrio sp. YE44]SDB50642.1 Type IV secretory system Conjugative DNA transfer [Pseudobutyrivibrio sp. YE44]